MPNTTLRDWTLALRGERTLYVGAAATELDYAELAAEYDAVVLVNHALALAPLFGRSARWVVIFSWHLDQFHQREEFLGRRVIPAAHAGDLVHLPGPAREQALLYRPVNHADFDDYARALGSDPAIRDRQLIARDNALHSCANTGLLALHFLYHAGALEIDSVGQSHGEQTGEPAAGRYDPRLAVPPEDTPGDPAWYQRGFETCCRELGIAVNYRG